MAGKTRKNWTARPYCDRDIGPLAGLYEIVHQRPFDAPFWQWLFQVNPAGKGDIWLAADGEVIAGQYATMPVAMTVAGRAITAAQSLHTMTHPDYRKQGIFTALARETYADIEQQGTELVYGFPNDSSFHGFVKYLDFFVLEDLPMRARPLRLEAILAARFQRPGLSRCLGRAGQQAFDRWHAHKQPVAAAGETLRIESATAFPTDIDRLTGSQARHFPNAVIRDHRYLSWRYRRHPNRSYEIILAYRANTLAGYCVCGRTSRKGLDIGLLMELYADPPQGAAVDGLITAALACMRANGMALAACVLPAASPLQKALRRHGFLFTLRRFPYILRPGPLAGPELKQLKNREAWHITFGDADFV
jgi:hypothetical protein